MNAITRRRFVRQAAMAGALSAMMGPIPAAAPARNRLGMFIEIDASPDKALAQVAALGLPTCEVYSTKLGMELGMELKAAMAKHHVDVTALFTMGPGPLSWDFYDGPANNGLTSKEWRRARIDQLKKGSDMALRCGIPALETHVGFIPENPRDPLYAEMVAAVRELNYTGPITIERETQGPEQIEDIRRSKIFLEQLLAQ